MTPPDTNEKMKAYWSFMAYFVATTTVIVLIGCFGFKTPSKENEKLKGELTACQRDKTFLNNFWGLMNNTRKMMLDSTKGDTSFMNLQITDSLKKMNTMINRDSVTSKNIYNNIVVLLNNLQQSKQGLRGVSGADGQIKDLKDQIDKKTAELNNLNELSRLTDAKQN
jgi:hypothetical protein